MSYKQTVKKKHEPTYYIQKSAKRGHCTRAEQECCKMTD